MSAYTNGRDAYEKHERCAFLNGYAPASEIDGMSAIKLWHAPEAQGEMLIQVARPHDAWRVDWARGWDDARDAAV